MKRIGIFCAVLAIGLMFTGCSAENLVNSAGGGSASSQTQSAASSEAPASSALSAGSVSDDLAGLQKYLTANAGFTGTPEKMQADIIGAKEGVRYAFSHGGKNNVSAELYEYDTGSLGETAQKILADVQKDGKFILMGQEINAVLSDNGKYLMIYKNSATDDDNKSYDAKVSELFRSFHS